jgi:hypothetical protein
LAVLGFIGVVTQQTGTLVAPSGISGITFTDPVAAENLVADALSDGQTDNGEADSSCAARQPVRGGGARRVTYAEAAVVQPFANTLFLLTLTGAQVEQVLRPRRCGSWSRRCQRAGSLVEQAQRRSPSCQPARSGPARTNVTCSRQRCSATMARRYSSQSSCSPATAR